MKGYGKGVSEWGREEGRRKMTVSIKRTIKIALPWMTRPLSTSKVASTGSDKFPTTSTGDDHVTFP